MTLNGNSPNPKRLRQRSLLDLIGRAPIGSQEELAERLRERGFEVTQATVSRDISELGLVKVLRGDRHVYDAPENAATLAYDARLRRLLEDIPVRVGRSGLSLVLVATPGSAGAIAQAIDQSSLTDQVGTLAGDNTLLVLFEDEVALERWLARFETFQPAARPETVTSPVLPPVDITPAHPSVRGGRATARALAHSEAPR